LFSHGNRRDQYGDDGGAIRASAGGIADGGDERFGEIGRDVAGIFGRSDAFRRGFVGGAGSITGASAGGVSLELSAGSGAGQAGGTADAAARRCEVLVISFRPGGITGCGRISQVSC